MRTPARKGILNAFWAEHTQTVQNLHCMDFSLVTLKLEDSGTILSKLRRKIISNLDFYIQPNYSWSMGVTWRLFQICKTSKLYLPYTLTQEANITSSLSIHLPTGTWVASVSWLLWIMLQWTWGCRYLVFISFGYIPRGGTAGLYGCSICNFLRSLHTVFLCSIYTQWNIIQPWERRESCYLQHTDGPCYYAEWENQTETDKYCMVSLICRICRIFYMTLKKNFKSTS